MTTTVQTQEDVSAILSEVTSVQGVAGMAAWNPIDRKSTRLNSSHSQQSRMPSSA